MVKKKNKSDSKDTGADSKNQALADFKTQAKALAKTISKLTQLKNKVLCILRKETAAKAHTWKTNHLIQW